MRKITFKPLMLLALATLTLLPTACHDDLLKQKPTTDLGASQFWKTEADATIALMGAYSAVRPVFDRDYYFDGQAEYTRVNGTSTTSGNLQLGDAYNGGNYNPSDYAASFDKYFRFLYGAVNRTNYVISNVNKMLETAAPGSVANLEAIAGEARLLRGMVYFRLISMWGDVPYFENEVSDLSENIGFYAVSRMPLAQVKDRIMEDFTYAFQKLPAAKPTGGRASKAAALAFRGKLQLYWASWNKNGWPELEGFVPDQVVANEAYAAAAADFKAVITNYGLTLFRGGDPGSIDALGKADILPNYFYLFMPVANNDPELIMSFNHGGINTNQGEELMRDFQGRSQEGSQTWIAPRYALADRYQLTTTGDFAPALVPMNPSTAGARTALNSAVNPNSYANRDYRMKSTLLWDYEMIMGMTSLKSTGFFPYIYQSYAQKVTIGGVSYTTNNNDNTNYGYVFRKFVRNYAGQGRSEGDYSWPVMRLADVFLMYAEATNEISGPQGDAIDLVNRVRRRGNLPPLGAAKIASKAAFFDAIEQERIVELVAEGHRSFDLRRWRALERVWGIANGNGVQTRDTWGAAREIYYRNTSVRTYQQNYIFRIPPGERDRNPNLTQNTPWL